MPVYVEMWASSTPELIPVEGDRATLGSEEGNDVVVADKTVSHLHAAIERVGPGWCIRDLGSRNGTFVNGQRILTDQVLKHGDEIRLGKSRLVFRSDTPRAPTMTHAVEGAPDLTRREKEVLDALCEPVARGDVFTDPASIKEMAAGLFVSEAAVKQHLSRLYQKFDIYEEGSDRRRVRLANEAIRRGAVNLANLRRSDAGN